MHSVVLSPGTARSGSEQVANLVCKRLAALVGWGNLGVQRCGRVHGELAALGLGIQLRAHGRSKMYLCCFGVGQRGLRALPEILA